MKISTHYKVCHKGIYINKGEEFTLNQASQEFNRLESENKRMLSIVKFTLTFDINLKSMLTETIKRS